MYKYKRKITFTESSLKYRFPVFKCTMTKTVGDKTTEQVKLYFKAKV